MSVTAAQGEVDVLGNRLLREDAVELLRTRRKKVELLGFARESLENRCRLSDVGVDLTEEARHRSRRWTGRQTYSATATAMRAQASGVTVSGI